MSDTATMTRDEALMWLNDQLGEVVVAIVTVLDSTAFPARGHAVLNVGGVLSRVNAPPVGVLDLGMYVIGDPAEDMWLDVQDLPDEAFGESLPVGPGGPPAHGFSVRLSNNVEMSVIRAEEPGA
jgi:hypothetical protein